MNPTEKILDQFNIQGKAILLPGGEGRTYRVGNFIIKHIGNDSSQYLFWIAELFNNIKEDGFRVSKPIPTKDGSYITNDGWSAWTYLEGNHEYKEHIQESIKAVIAFHQAIKDVEKPSFIDKEDNPYIRADKYAWGEKPNVINNQIKEQVEQLYALLKPVNGLKDQLIHGDLNPDNILVSPHFPPAIIDIAPYWRPLEFALAVYAYWIGPWRNDPKVLEYFSNIKEFDQMLIRAAIRMLLIMSEFNNVTNLNKYTKATEIVVNYVKK